MNQKKRGVERDKREGREEGEQKRTAAVKENLFRSRMRLIQKMGFDKQINLKHSHWFGVLRELLLADFVVDSLSIVPQERKTAPLASFATKFLSAPSLLPLKTRSLNIEA